MFIILSPAKTLDFKTTYPEIESQQPRLTEESSRIMRKLKTISKKGLRELMDISAKLAEENFERFIHWNYPFPKNTAIPAVYAFKGDVYLGLVAREMNQAEITEANRTLRILSGLHGILRPLDLILPYRLEMGTKLAIGRKKNLYQFWGDSPAKLLLEDMKEQNSDTLINLASNEYYEVLSPFLKDIRIITPVFREFTKGKYRFVSFNAKRARGAMAAWVIKNNLESAEDLKGFEGLGYSYNDKMSLDDNWYFTKD